MHYLHGAEETELMLDVASRSTQLAFSAANYQHSRSESGETGSRADLAMYREHHLKTQTANNIRNLQPAS